MHLPEQPGPEIEEAMILGGAERHFGVTHRELVK